VHVDQLAGETVSRADEATCGRVLTDHPRGHDLPGLLASVVPLDVDDGRGGRYALLWDRRSGTLSAVQPCSPIGVDLADPGQVGTWIAGLGALLADVATKPWSPTSRSSPTPPPAAAPPCPTTSPPPSTPTPASWIARGNTLTQWPACTTASSDSCAGSGLVDLHRRAERSNRGR
jgi:hypothetical protein